MAAFLWRHAGRPASPLAFPCADGVEITAFARLPAWWLTATDVTTNNPYRPTTEVTLMCR
jgi:hypothetical protein